MVIPASEEAMIKDLLNILRVTEQWMSLEPVLTQAGSAFAEDNTRADPYEVSHAVTRSINVAVDHLHCLRMAMTGQGDAHIGLHAFAPFSLLRGALENAATAIWIASPDDSEQRVLRCLRYEWASLCAAGEFLALGGAADDQATQDALRDRKDRLLETADKFDGSAISRGKVKKEAGPQYVVEEAGKHIAPTGDDALLAPLLWRLCSAVAHGDPWPLTFFPLEITGSLAPGVSQGRYTAPTSLAHSGARTARLMIAAAMHLLRQRSQSRQ